MIIYLKQKHFLNILSQAFHKIGKCWKRFRVTSEAKVSLIVFNCLYLIHKNLVNELTLSDTAFWPHCGWPSENWRLPEILCQWPTVVRCPCRTWRHESAVALCSQCSLTWALTHRSRILPLYLCLRVTLCINLKTFWQVEKVLLYTLRFLNNFSNLMSGMKRANL